MKIRAVGDIARCRRCGTVYQWVSDPDKSCRCGRCPMVAPDLLDPQPAHLVVDGLDEFCLACISDDETAAFIASRVAHRDGTASN